ncbi:MAG: anaerobic ribonucleoside-triphosphate reductase activating protein [Candidatus Nanohaloarchaea archaeon]|nr:anaerobic ribonucleoside-triphosphate reductase activating protein [Candidatus Nanohaloarchaea archaeon]
MIEIGSKTSGAQFQWGRKGKSSSGSLPIKGFQEVTLTDFPDKVACIVFTPGCSLRCPYCYNPEMVFGKGELIPERDVLNYLEKREDMLDGLVVTGGEPTIHSCLSGFIENVKSRFDLEVKLDSNGTDPEVLKNLVEKELVDYIAMDVKTELESYSKLGASGQKKRNIGHSINLVKDMERHEFRTTVVPGITTEKSIRKIGKRIQGADRYFLQQFRPENTLDPAFEQIEPFPKQKLERLRGIAEKFVGKCEIRNV